MRLTFLGTNFLKRNLCQVHERRLFKQNKKMLDKSYLETKKPLFFNIMLTLTNISIFDPYITPLECQKNLKHTLITEHLMIPLHQIITTHYVGGAVQYNNNLTITSRSDFHCDLGKDAVQQFFINEVKLFT